MLDVTICIPTHNRAAMLEKTLLHVLAQTYKDFQVVVVDDASTDGTEQVVRGLGDSRVKYFKNRVNLGLVKNFNECLKHATADYFVLHPDDDYMKPHALETLLGAMKRNAGLGYVFAGCDIVDETGKLLKRQMQYAESGVFSARDRLSKHLLGNDVYLCSALFSRKAVEEAGGFENFWHVMDWCLELNISMSGYPVGFVAEPLGYFTFWTGSWSYIYEEMQQVGGQEYDTLSLFFNDRRLAKYFSAEEINDLKIKALASWLEGVKRGCRNGVTEKYRKLISRVTANIASDWDAADISEELLPQLKKLW